MVIYNLEYKVLDKLGRAKNSVHVGLFKTEDDVELAKKRIYEDNTEHKIAFDVYIIDDPFLKIF